MYLYSSSSVKADVFAGSLPPVFDRKLAGMKPRADRTVSDSFVDTIRFRLSAVSVLRQDSKTVVKFKGKPICSYIEDWPLRDNT